VALLHAAADGSTLTQLRVALDAAAKGQQTNTSVRIGDVPYDKLMSPPVLDQVRKREAATPGVSPRGFLTRILELAALIESSATRRSKSAMSRSRISVSESVESAACGVTITRRFAR